MMNHINSHYLWWKDGVLCQIYPRSFMDTNGDDAGETCSGESLTLAPFEASVFDTDAPLR